MAQDPGLYGRWATDADTKSIAISYMWSGFREVLTARMSVNRIKRIFEMTALQQDELDRMIDYFQTLDAANQDLYTDRWLLDVMYLCEYVDPAEFLNDGTTPNPNFGLPTYDRTTAAAALGLDFGLNGQAVSVQLDDQYITPSQIAKWLDLNAIRRRYIEHLLP